MEKVTYEKPAENLESNGLFVGIDFHEGDQHSPEPGKLYGTMTVRDDRGTVVKFYNLLPEDFKDFEAGFAKLKERALKPLNVKVVKTEEEKKDA